MAEPMRTPFAVRYGVLSSNRTRAYYAKFPTPKKSFLTPLSPEKATATPLRRSARDMVEKVQIRLNEGFTVRELYDLDALSSRQLDPINLTNPIHPLLERSRWRAKGFESYPLDDGNAGNRDWVASNDLVWEQLEPCLRLATLITAHLHKSPFFDALLLAPRVAVDPTRLSAESKLAYEGFLEEYFTTFSPRPSNPYNIQQCQDTINELVGMMLPGVFMGLGDLNGLPASGKPLPGNQKANGSTRVYKGEMSVWLSYGCLAPLLQKEVSSAERRRVQFSIACTITHELVHAFYLAKIGAEAPERFAVRAKFGGYFMDETTSEHGWSAMAAILEGIVVVRGMNIPAWWALGAFLTSWPVGSMGSIHDLIHPPIKELIAIPLTTSYFEALYRQDYWDSYVLKFGSMKPPPANIASRRDISQSNSTWQILLKDSVGTDVGSTIANFMYLTKEARETQASLLTFNIGRDYIWAMRDLDAWVRLLQEQFEICAISKGTEGFVADFNNLAKILKETVARHQTLVQRLPEMEKNKSVVRDTREHFISFNRHLRIIVRSCIGGDNELASLLFTVDNCCLELCPPPDSVAGAEETLTRKTQEEAAEQEILRRAHVALSTGDFASSQTFCNHLLSSVGCSSFSQASVRIALGQNPLISVEERRTFLQAALTILNRLIPPPQWVDTLNTSRGLANTALAALESEDLVMSEYSAICF